MSGETPTLMRTWTVGRYTAELTAGPTETGVMNMVIDWSPHVPNDFTPSQIEEYRRHLASAAAELAELARNNRPK
ncbi:hypothetical protein [Roseateles puraquae]|uniref:hypothetical protein n=1 Tax=Roseateles puraquae TaxID=431059 RepID=UPI001184D473|nr:hypothetical protein [Roseateles puraquae]MDG0856369.1 hypothetical protein [Roseateles puraquae]